MNHHPTPRLRDAHPDDLARVEALNAAAVPHVNAIPHRLFARFQGQAPYFRVAERDGELLGFLLALGPEIDYDSPNFLWFRERYDAFLYIDRIVVAATARRLGLGTRSAVRGRPIRRLRTRYDRVPSLLQRAATVRSGGGGGFLVEVEPRGTAARPSPSPVPGRQRVGAAFPSVPASAWRAEGFFPSALPGRRPAARSFPSAPPSAETPEVRFRSLPKGSCAAKLRFRWHRKGSSASPRRIRSHRQGRFAGLVRNRWHR